MSFLGAEEMKEALFLDREALVLREVRGLVVVHRDAGERAGRTKNRDVVLLIAFLLGVESIYQKATTRWTVQKAAIVPMA